MDRETAVLMIALLLMGTWVAAGLAPEVSLHFLLDLLAGAVVLWVMRERISKDPRA